MDQRQAERAKVCRKLSISTDPTWESSYQEPALSRDLSITGACVTTNKPLQPGQKVFVRISTDGCPHQWHLPKEIRGAAEVKRVDKQNEGVRQVALRFDTPLAGSMEFGFFMAFLLGRDPDLGGAMA